MRRVRIGPVLIVAAVLAALACYVVPRGLEANSLLAIEDDPAQHRRPRARRRNSMPRWRSARSRRRSPPRMPISPQSFVELSAERQVALDPALTEESRTSRWRKPQPRNMRRKASRSAW